MHTIDIASLLARMQQAREQIAHPVIATDADGTLWSGDVGVDTFERMLSARAVRADALPALLETARAHGISASGDANEVASALYAAFQRGAYPETACYEMMAWAFAGFTLDEARAFARDALHRASLGARFHDEMRAVVAWARSTGVRVVVVSASPRLVVQCGVEELGIAPSDVVGATPRVVEGVIVPGMAEPMPYGEHKVTALRTKTADGLLAAFGDNVFDLPMLRIAALSIAVRPKARLRAAAQAADGLLELVPSS